MRLLQDWKRARRSGLASVSIIVVAVLGFRSAVADWYDVPTGSMQPTILVGDRIVVNKLAYDLRVPLTGITVATWDDPDRGDIVVCDSPVDGTRLVKRVVGVPGDTIAMRDGRLIVNGDTLAYAPDQAAGAPLGDDGRGLVFEQERLGGVDHAVARTPWRRAVRDFGPVTVPADRCFVMGDNRDNSADSRHWGFVRRDDVAGRAVGLALSLDRGHGWRPRWSRFGRGLI